MLLLLIMLAAGANCSPAISRNSGAIFPVSLGENPWIENLRNPCKHENPEAARRQPMATHEQILSVRGREHEIRSMAGNLLRRMRSLYGYLVSKTFS